MGLSSDLVAQFVKITNDNKPNTKKETTVYGTTVEYKGSIYVKIDGSDLLTPVMATANTKPGERVTVMIKNHTATVTGNLSSPAARLGDLDKYEDIADVITEFEIVIANKVDTEELNAEVARIDELRSDTITVKEKLTAAEADIDNLQASSLTVTGKLTAAEADIDHLQSSKIDVTIADAKYATIANLDATNADINALEATYADFTVATADRFTAMDAKIDNLAVGEFDAVYANIDFSNIGTAAIQTFFSKSGIIEDVIVGDGTVTGRLVGVTISGDLIEGNTVVAEKLVIKGEDGLYYKLNTDGMNVETEQTEYNSLNGSVIKAKSITATKISVSDLVAFDATLAGLHMTDGTLYSGAKASVNNASVGFYLDKDGQVAIGDSLSYIKYYTDSDGKRKLLISADSIVFGSNKQSIESAIDSIDIGGRNYIITTKLKSYEVYNTTPVAENGIISTTYQESYAPSTPSYLTLKVDGYMPPNEVMTLSGYIKVNGEIPETNFFATRASTYATDLGINEYDPTTGYFRCTQLYSGTKDWIIHAHTTRTAGSTDVVTFEKLKLEKGNKATDWTAAPEEMATVVDVDEIKTTSEDAQARIAAAEALIEVLSESISMLVTDGSGASLMTQTENGWTFSTAELQSLVNRTAESLEALTHEVGSTNGTVSALQQAVNDLGELAEYVKIGTYNGEPCIELGEGDSDFKLRITNTQIMFMEGTNVPAYFTNQSMHIKKAVIEDELQQGGFVWKARSNGNLGLVWKGVTE